jgi:argininosuccinate lyase
MQRRCRLADLPLAEFQTAHPELTDEVFRVLGVEQAVAAFASYGSTAPVEVAKQVQRWQEKIAKEAHNTAGAT